MKRKTIFIYFFIGKSWYISMYPDFYTASRNIPRQFAVENISDLFPYITFVKVK